VACGVCLCLEISDIALQKLRTLLSIIGGKFATVVPFLLVLYSSSADAAPVYGQTTSHSKVYAYCAQERTYHASLAYCASLWMKPVSILSSAENEAVMQLIQVENKKVFIGAAQNCSSTALDEEKFYTWADGSAWNYTAEWQPNGQAGAGSVAMFKDGGLKKIVWEQATDAGSARGVVRAAPSLAAIRGAVPKILQLGGADGISFLRTPNRDRT